MDWLQTAINIMHVFSCVALVALILLQHGKGADAGAAFGSGASQTVFGSQGGATLLTKLTSVFAVVFFVTSFSLAIYAKNRADSLKVDEGIKPEHVIELEDDAAAAANDAASSGEPDDNVEEMVTVETAVNASTTSGAADSQTSSRATTDMVGESEFEISDQQPASQNEADSKTGSEKLDGNEVPELE